MKILVFGVGAIGSLMVHYLQRKTTVDHPQKAVNEMYRIIKKDGYLLLNDMDCVALIRAVANIIFPRLKAGDVKMYNKEEILAMMKTAGFKKVKYRKISPFSFQCIARK